MSGTQHAPAEARRPTVFLSYARADQAQATRLAETLEAAGLDVWWDALIEGGAAFAQWLTLVGASTGMNRIAINDPRHDVDAVVAPSARWIFSSRSSFSPAPNGRMYAFQPGK